MAQIIYAIAALMTVMVLSVNLLFGITAGERRVYFNELATQMTGVASEVLGDISRRGISFDAATNEYVWSVQNPGEPIPFPLVTSAGQLTDPSNFGQNGCVDFRACIATSETNLEDFYGLEFSIDADGLLYEVDIEVRYVDETDPLFPSSTQTWAKEVIVGVRHPAAHVGGNPLNLRVSRVFAYERIRTN